VRELPDDPSQPLSLRYSYPFDQEAANGPRLFELLRDQWGEVSVELTLTAMEAEALITACCPAFDYDVIGWGWFTSTDPGGLLNIATTAQIPAAINETGYSNPEYDALFEQQLVTVDKAERAAIIHQMQEILLRDVPYIFPWYAESVFAHRTDTFTGWAVDQGGLLNLFDRLSLVNGAPVR